MGLFDNFPYTNFHELNVDWVLIFLKQLSQEVENYKALNKVSYGGIWDISKNYERWVIVSDGNTAYISTDPVPPNVAITNEKYWLPVANLDPKIIGIENSIATIDSILGVHTTEIKQLQDRFTDLQTISPVINVLDYGAINDGITDCSVAIENAISASLGKPIVFPEGVYAISRPIVIPREYNMSVYLLGSEIKAVREMETVIDFAKHTNETAPELYNQTIGGSGKINANGLSKNGIRIPGNSAYSRIENMQILSFTECGIIIGTDETDSSQCYITNSRVYGTPGKLGTIGLCLKATDNMVSNFYSYNCEIGIEHWADQMNNIHIWVDATKFTLSQMKQTVGVRTKSVFWGGQLYLDALAVGVSLVNENSKFFGEVNYYNPYNIDISAVIFSVLHSNVVNLAYLHIDPGGLTKITPIQLRDYTPNSDFVGSGRFRAYLGDAYYNEKINNLTDFSNIGDGAPHALAYEFGTLTAGYHLIGWCRATNSHINIRVETPSKGLQIAFTTGAGGWVDNTDHETLYGSTGGCRIALGTSITNENGEFIPIYFNPGTDLEWAYVNLYAEVVGSQGLYPNYTIDIDNIPTQTVQNPVHVFEFT